MTLKRKLDHLTCVTAGVWAVIRALGVEILKLWIWLWLPPEIPR